MGLLDELLDAAADQVDSNAADWLGQAINVASTQLVPQLPGEDEQEFARDGLDLLRSHVPAMAGLSKGVAINVLVSLATGQEGKAKLAYLRQDASFDELMSALDQVDQAVLDDYNERQAQWESLKEMGKKSLPLLLRGVLLVLAA